MPKWSGSELVDSFSIFEDPEGRVGIGTLNPEADLHIEDVTGSSGGLLRIDAENENPWSIIIGNKTAQAQGNDEFGMYASDTGNFSIARIGGGVAFEIDRDDNVGIGTKDPGDVLNVAGTIRANNNADRERSGHSNGAFFASSTLVTTEAGFTTIKQRVGHEGSLNVVSGLTGNTSRLDRFVDVVLLLGNMASPVVIASQTRDNPPNRSYVVDTGSQDFRISLTGGASGTYRIFVTGIGGDETVLLP